MVMPISSSILQENLPSFKRNNHAMLFWDCRTLDVDAYSGARFQSKQSLMLSDYLDILAHDLKYKPRPDNGILLRNNIA